MADIQELTPEEFEAARKRLIAALTCPICGVPMVHSRLRGYHCHDERHNEIVHEMQHGFDVARYGTKGAGRPTRG